MVKKNLGCNQPLRKDKPIIVKNEGNGFITLWHKWDHNGHSGATTMVLSEEEAEELLDQLKDELGL